MTQVMLSGEVMDEVQEFVKDISYKPVWKFYIEAEGGTGAALVTSAFVPDSQDDNPKVVRLTEVHASLSITTDWFSRNGEINAPYWFQMIKQMITSIEEHERQEWLRFRGEPLVDPHDWPEKGIVALTPKEQQAMDVTVQLANVMREIIGDGPCATGDWNEVAHSIHDIQARILSQLGSRTDPPSCRPLGGRKE